MDFEIGYVHYDPRYGYETDSDWDGVWYSKDIERATIVAEPYGDYTVPVGYGRTYWTNHRIMIVQHKGKNAGRVSARCLNCGCSSKGRPKASEDVAISSLKDTHLECSKLMVWRIT